MSAATLGRILAALTGLWLVVGPASAHEVRPAYLSIDETGAGDYDVLFKVPALGNQRLPLAVALPPACEAPTDSRREITDGAAVERFRVRCPSGLVGEVVGIDGLTATATDVLARFETADGAVQTVRLFPEAPSFVPAGTPSSSSVATTYFVIGVEHILFGIDHLLFVSGLLLLVGGWRRLLATITAFTLAHSVTLALVAAGGLTLPQAPVEALIALSIVIVACEVIKAARGEALFAARFPWVVAFGFGLLHGLGFGGALREIGLPPSDVPLALLTFNLGVEAGQLVYVAVVMAIVAMVPALTRIRRLAPLRPLATYAIGSVAAFWFVERLAAMG